MEPLAQIDVVIGAAAPVGVNGLVTATAHAVGLAPDLALGLSGAAFRAYFFTPDDNHGWAHDHPDVLWQHDALVVDHYGALEALGTHAGVDVRVYDRLGVRDAVALLRHELGAGRPVLAALDAELTRWGRVRALRIRDVGVEDATAPEGEAISVPVYAGADEPPVFALAPVRPAPERASDRRRHLLQRDVLGYVAAHARSGRELYHRDEVFYAAGARAMQVAADLLDTAPATPDAAFDTFFDAWLSELARARLAAAAFFDAWAEGCACGDEAWYPLDPAALRGAGAAWHHVAAAIDEALGPNATRAHRATCLRAAAVREPAAVAATATASGGAGGTVF